MYIYVYLPLVPSERGVELVSCGTLYDLPHHCFPWYLNPPHVPFSIPFPVALLLFCKFFDKQLLKLYCGLVVQNYFVARGARDGILT
jgi:hypothetical protein